MIVVLGHLDVRPETVDRVAAASAELAAASRTEAGCREYAFSTDVATPHRFYAHEVWESEDALLAHLQRPNVQAFLAFIGEVAAAPPVVTRYDVGASRPLF